MTKTFLTATAVSALAITAASAQVQEPRPYADEPNGFYAGIGYTFVDIETDSDIEEFDDQGDNTNALTVRAGYQITPVFSIEADATFGIDDGDFDLDDDEIDFSDLDTGTFGEEIDTDNIDRVVGNGGDIGLDYLVGIYGRVTAPINEQFQISGRVGYAFAEVDSTNRLTVTEIDDLGDTDDTNDVTTVTTVEQSIGGSDDGLAFGASARYAFDDVNAIRADYTRYNFGEANADAITIVYQRTFGGPAIGY